MKTPEELAEECKNKIAQRDIYAMGTLTQREQDYLKEAFLAGYQAAKEQLPPFHAGAYVYIIDANNPLPKPMPLSIAEQNQFADTRKVMDSSDKSNGWILVNDRLPVPHRAVMWCLIDNLMAIGSFDHDQRGIFIDSCFFKLKEATHWMPLPTPPEE